MGGISNGFEDEGVVETRSGYIVVKVVYCAKRRVGAETKQCI